MRGRRGFSFPEIMITLAVTTIVASLATVGYRATRDNVSSRSAVPLLVAAQLEARRALVDGAFPAAPASVMAPIPGAAYVAGGPAGPDEVSVFRADASTLLLAARAGDGCMVLVDLIGAATGWALDAAGAGRCEAEAAWVLLDGAELGTESDPVEVTIP